LILAGLFSYNKIKEVSMKTKIMIFLMLLFIMPMTCAQEEQSASTKSAKLSANAVQEVVGIGSILTM